MSASYPTAQFRRSALAPAILATIVLLAAVPLVDGDWFTIVRYAVSILALIVAVLAWQAHKRLWLLLLVPVAIVWNPVFPLDLDNELWVGLHYVAAIVFILAGVFIKVPNEDDRNRRS